MTSFGSRLSTVHLALESIGAGGARPERMILWVKSKSTALHPSPELKRLADRGLEIRWCQDYGSHSKYYHSLSEIDESRCRLVTADDDLIYGKGWLSLLVDGAKKHPDLYLCHRAHRV